MRALPRAPLPPGPSSQLFDELHALHHAAGRPSLREMAAAVGCSHTTISTAFSGVRVPKWGLLELIVETLGGETGHFKKLWVAATESGADQEPVAGEIAYVVPHDLPAAPVPFVGRTEDLAGLDTTLRDARAGASAPVALIAGAAGVGKTSLAVAWSHAVADQHPDGQLYLDLRGYDVSHPRTAASAADAILRRLGVPPHAVPRELTERSALLRSHLTGRRLLLVLDNAFSAEQVQPLLPGSTGCFVVVTSRGALPGLVARAGARRHTLDRLDQPAAADLLTRLLGEPARRDPDAVRELASRCARLPLALRVAAEAATDPAHTLAEHVARFDRRTARLDLLDAGGDERTGVRSVFSWSLRRLSPPAAEMFVLLGLSPARELDDDAATALLGAPPPVAAAALAELARAHLIERHADTFGLHDLLRDYVIELAAQRPEADRRRARLRLFDHYLTRCRRSATDPAWLARHRPALVAVALSAARDSPAHCLELAAVLHQHLEDSGHYEPAILLQRAAVEVARARPDTRSVAAALGRLAGVLRRAGAFADSLAAATEAREICEAEPDRAGLADALQAMAVVHVRLGQNALGAEELGRAAEILRDLGDRAGEAAAENRRGIALMQLGRLTEALDLHRRAYDIYGEIDAARPRGAAEAPQLPSPSGKTMPPGGAGVPLGIAGVPLGGAAVSRGRAANNVGVLCMRLGRHDEARAALTESLAIATGTGNRAGAGVALANLAELAERQGRWSDAADGYREAIEVFERLGYLGGLADARRGLGLTLARLGSWPDGHALLLDALELARRIGEADVETAARNDLGLLDRLTGRDGSEHYLLAYASTDRTGDLYQRARALDGLAHCARAAGRPDDAHAHWRAALAIFSELGVPEAGRVAAALSD